jgi:hypothetical protein
VGGPLKTAEGITLGSSRSDLQEAFGESVRLYSESAEAHPDVAGAEFFTIEGSTLSGRLDGGAVTYLSAGSGKDRCTPDGV